MLGLLKVAASGALASQQTLDVAANNLANVGTTGFKARRVDLADRVPGQRIFSVDGQSLAEREVGLGVAAEGTLAVQSRGTFQATDRPLDVAIAGEGWFQLALPDGRAAFTRDGSFRIDGQGRLVSASTGLAAPGILIPAGATGISIESDGRVMARLAGADRREIGRLTLARFVNPDGLLAVGENALVPTAASGEPIPSGPGRDGLGTLQTGGLELSNVDVGVELTRVLQAQRAYQVNLRSIRTIDEMLQEANNLRR